MKLQARDQLFPEVKHISLVSQILRMRVFLCLFSWVSSTARTSPLCNVRTSQHSLWGTTRSCLARTHLHPLNKALWLLWSPHIWQPSGEESRMLRGCRHLGWHLLPEESWPLLTVSLKHHRLPHLHHHRSIVHCYPPCCLLTWLCSAAFSFAFTRSSPHSCEFSICMPSPRECCHTYLFPPA